MRKRVLMVKLKLEGADRRWAVEPIHCAPDQACRRQSISPVKKADCPVCFFPLLSHTLSVQRYPVSGFSGCPL